MKLARLLYLPSSTAALIAGVLVAAFPAQSSHPAPRQAVIVAAAIRSYEPHYIVDAQGDISGFAVEVLDAVAERAGARVDYRIYDSPEAAIGALAAGEIDLIPNIGVTSTRWRIGIPSAPYETLRIHLFIRAGERGVSGFEDLRGRNVGVVSLGSAAEALNARGLATQDFTSLADALRALLDGRIEVLAFSRQTVERLAAAWGTSEAIEISGPPLEDANRGMVFAASRATLFVQLAPLLHEFTSSPEFDNLHRRWFAPNPADGRVPWPWLAGAVIMLAAFAAYVAHSRRALTASIADDPEQQRLEKQLWRRIVTTAVIIEAAAVVVALVALAFLYRTAIEEARGSLIERMDSEASLIEAVARFDRAAVGAAAIARSATLSQLKDGLGGSSGEGEVVLAERSGDAVVFVLRQRASRPLAPLHLPFGSELAQAAQRALLGQRGTLVGLDYRGQRALAAYRPLAGLNLAYVVKKDMHEIQAPFVRAAFVVVAASLGLALLGSLLYFRIAMPSVRSVLQSEALFRSLFRTMSDGVAVYRAIDDGEDFVVTKVNLAAERLERHPAAALQGSRVSALQERGDSGEFLATLRDIWRNGGTRHLPARRYHLDGRVTWRSYEVFRLPSGKIVAVFDDVTEREEALSALRESEERFRQIAESIREVFWVAEPSMNRLTYVSPAFEQVWGEPPDRFYKDLSQLFATLHPDDRDRAAEAFMDDTAGPFDVEYRIVRPDGSIRWIRDRGFPVQDVEGRPYRTVGVADDVTKQKEREYQLFQAQKLDAVGQLTGGVAHDFNNLLQTVLCNVDLLRLHVESDEETVELIDAIEDASLSGARLVDNMLAFARRKPIAVSEVDVNETVMRMRPLIATLGRDLEVELRLAAPAALVLTDEDYLKAAILNLLVNARDAMPRGGIVVLSTSLTQVAAEAPAPAPDLGPGTYVVVEVKDSGIGIAAADLQRVFEPFFTTKEPGEGTGLGLPMVYGFARQCGGSSAITSTPGRGTAARIYLPRCEAAALPARPVVRSANGLAVAQP